MNQILPSENTTWGFWGTMAREGDNTAAAWDLASTALRRVTGAGADGVRGFLDSSHGRHFADDVAAALAAGQALPAAIDAVVSRWMGYRISRSAARRAEIPAGQAYLTGLVSEHEFLKTEAAA